MPKSYRPRPLLAVLHFQRIEEAMEELKSLSKSCAAPAPESIQFLGTVVDNTAALLTAPSNSIDKRGRVVLFDNKRGWTSLMQAVHPSFFSSVHLATEAALIRMCDQHNIQVFASQRLRAERLVERLKGKIGEREAKEILELTGARPQFNDILNAVMEGASLSSSVAGTWRKYFRALSIIRNKASHLDTTLSATEIADLRDGGFQWL